MSLQRPRFRIAAYNIHKCRGFDMRIVPSRILAVLQELDADILCLQEVMNGPSGPPQYDQAGQFQRAFPSYACAFGSNRIYRGCAYGNLILSRLPMHSPRNHDLSRPRREPRGVLQVTIQPPRGPAIHLFNVHLGTGHMERRYQARKLMNTEVLQQPGRTGPRLVLGDFNEWTQGLTTRLLSDEFQTFRPRHVARIPKTFPGMLPLLTLDHCYYEPPLNLEATHLWRSRKALFASDHLPLIAEFSIALPAEQPALADSMQASRQALRIQ